MKNLIIVNVFILSSLFAQVDYATQIQPIWNSNCTSCHTSTHSSGLNLTTNNSFNELVDVASEGASYGGALRVASGDPGSSVLYDKITGGGTYGGQMPPGGLMSASNQNLVQTWITELGSSTYITIADARNQAEGTNVTVRGIITTPNFQSSNTEYGLQDATAGITIFRYGELLTLNVGDSVEVTGDLDDYNGKLEIVPSGASDITIISSDNNLPDFQVVTVVTFVANGEDYESELIRINGASITSGSWPTGGSANLTISDDGGTSTVTMRIDSDMDIIGNPEPTAPFDVQGIAGQYNDYQILPRYYTDFSAAGAVAPTIADITMDPTAPTDADDVTISATVTDDSSIVSVTLTYDAGSGDTDVVMSNTTGDTYTGTIPAQTSGVTVTYTITAVDNSGSSTESDEETYTVLPSGVTITSIYDIQYTTDATGDSPLDGQTVTISGVVTAEFWGSSSNRYLHVQDAEGPWNGIVCFEYDGWDDFDFTSSAGTVHSVAEGDSVTVTGTVDEYNNLTEIVDVTEVIVHGSVENMISPSVVTPGQVMTGGTDAEAYEGCLVAVVDVTVDDPDLGYGEWSISDGTNSMRVDDIWDYYYFPEAGHSLAEVSGVMTYTYSNTKLLPRLARDIIEADSEPVRLQRIQQVLYSDLIASGEDEESDISYMYGDTVTVEGIVTMPTGLSYAGAGIKFIFQDENGGPWSSILSYDPDSSAFPVLYEGDRIEATGYVYEYSTGPSNMTELFITEPVNILSVGEVLPDAELIESGDLRWPTTAEQWGNVTVRIEEGTVTNNDLQYEIFEVDDGSGGVLVDDDSDSIEVHFDAVGPPPVGTFISSIEGWIYHHYGDYGDSTAYKLEPLYMSDIDFGAGPPVISDVSRDPCAPGPSDIVEVSATIVDNSYIASADIMYSVDGGTYQSVAMVNNGFNPLVYIGDIPATGTEGARVNYYITATDDGVDQDEAKTSTFPYDTDENQFSYVSKDGDLSIEDIQFTDWGSGDSPYDDCEVTITGIITADTAQYNSGYGAYAIQSEANPWFGIVFDSWDDTELTRGDEVTITGIVAEFDAEWHFKYDNNTKIIDVSAVTVNSTGNAITAMNVSTADLAHDGDEVESYEGCLVTISNVSVSSVNSYDWSITDDSGVECLIDDDMATMEANSFMSEFSEGTTLETVSGIFNFSFGTYKIQIRDMADLGQLGIDDDFVGITREFALYPNFPNPFNPETRIRFQLAENSNVKLMIYDVLGRKIRTLVSNRLDAGHHIINWNGLDDKGVDAASGMYIYRIKAGDFIDHRKMLLVR
ncbi:MAG: T9SS type A sorting domain-containing protein [Candidatus Marinimicrobia bacterium]|nr:T9SS type A sorting domain-containing protein [Candidatus Neomarinimicrobiota bacterium]MBL7047654.1 T9SS type A sorting domain-containing protein [Candidatus Neomarinimicrobiota bacterium]